MLPETVKSENNSSIHTHITDTTIKKGSPSPSSSCSPPDWPILEQDLVVLDLAFVLLEVAKSVQMQLLILNN